MKIAIVYDSKTQHTQRAAAFICAGCNSQPHTEARTFHVDEVDSAFLREADGVIIGGPTYFASISAALLSWIQTAVETANLAGKLGGAFATAKYIHGGAENVLSTILAHELTCGMMVYSSGNSQGSPCIHLGPVSISPNIDDFQELFTIYGQRFAQQLAKLH